ncbi:hypothetical protein SPRG_01901 [Saprolegnia parasitica CBS 223.65]|uniref:F-box domain-containing protein n=1 Tax=Saprolegnia parasitica (strain CBS 223.65) TaxID=695850 RepID=A0A067D245_SAPPC|nr:hypothetical protein SPRG_01901 [Saprolegnia parasitica CBS 223.65]KDO33087.1 hypothetical protein SPRG_01901 [Saprolegnia parasitica CBS 223.65]|eukprot:XP_012195857.1 hypothetical protein SPRG_01901 [Saprolegnia parasitica CBS 223.65]
MTTKRARGTLTPALALDHVRLSIVQSLRSWQDVVAFLGALPASSLDRPLTALRDLPLTWRNFIEQWPMPCLDYMSPEAMHLALAALPAIPSIEIYCVTTLEETPSGHHDDLGALAAAWSTKIECVDKPVDTDSVDFCRRVLPHCSRLKLLSFEASVCADVLPLLPSSVCKIHIFNNNSNFGDGGVVWRIAAPLQQWLSTGHDKRVVIHGPLPPDDAAAVADVVVTATSLVELNLYQAPELAHALEGKALSRKTRAESWSVLSLPSLSLVAFVNHADFWSNLASLVQVLRPIKTLMDLFETHDVTLADVYAG